MSSETTTPSILIIGVGNRWRRDDGVGPTIAQRVAAQLSLVPGVDDAAVGIREESGEGMALIESWRDAESAIVIDAVCSGEEPGTLFEFNAGDAAIPARFFHYSTHAFSLAEAVEVARVLGALPRRLLVFGIEGEDFDAGEGLSSRIEAAVPNLVERVCAAARACMSHPV